MPNPFYLALILVSVLFLMTVLGYLVSPYVQEQHLAKRRAGPGPGSVFFAEWLDRHGPVALEIELVVMLISGALAMLSDRFLARMQKTSESSPTE